MVFLQLLLMIPSFGRPLSQLLSWDKHPCTWGREQFLERGTLLSDIVIRSQHSRNRYDTEEDVFLQLLLMDAGVKEGYLVSDGGFFQGSGGQGFEQDEGTV